MNQYLFDMPVRVYQKQGAVRELAKIAAEWGKKVAFVVDPFFSGTEMMGLIREDFKNEKLEFTEYNDVSSNPHSTAIDAMIEDVKQKECDVVVAIGGGSALDTAKAIAIVAIHGGKCWEYTERADEEVKRPLKGRLPIIVVPTTSGTGSEATPFSVINNAEIHLKATIVNHLAFPDIAILDPELTKSMPPMLTAITGIDAFAHCLEAYTSSASNDFTDLVSLEGMRLFSENIRIAVKEPENMDARNKMALASMYGGMAIAGKGTTMPHAIGQALGGIYNMPHGGALAVVLPACVRWTLPEGSEKMAKIAEILDPSIRDENEIQKAAKLPEIMERLWMEILGQKVTCETYGMKADGIDAVADATVKCYYGDCKCNPRIPLREDIVEILKDCLV
ncbi:MAG: iron-containing alcohol dehydrogenase [Lachnospiraceae bacterium]